MKITAVRIRVLRSHSTGYGHDAAEFEATLDEGDDAVSVAADLRRMCETEVRQAHEISRAYTTLESLREQIVGYERSVEGKKAESKKLADMVRALQSNAINDFKKFYRSVDALFFWISMIWLICALILCTSFRTSSFLIRLSIFCWVVLSSRTQRSRVW